MIVISIQSQVAWGHVGNSAAVPALQALGVAVAAVPTTLFSNHPRHPTLRGRVVDPDLLADLLRGVEERGLIGKAAVLLTGYLGSPANAEIVAGFVARARAANPALLYVCDAVIGDDDSGVFVKEPLPALFRDRLVPQADIATPNQFEVEVLSGRPARTLADLRAAVAVLQATGTRCVVVTGCTLAETPAGMVETIAFDGGTMIRVPTPRLAIRPSGTGDLFTGLLVAHLVRGQPFPAAVEAAVAGIFAVLKRTEVEGSYELSLAPSLAEILRIAPPPR